MKESPFRVVPFEPDHLLQIDLGGYERTVFSGLDIELLATNWPGGPAFTAVRGERVLGSAGLTVEDRVGTTWAAFSEELRRRPVFLLRAVRRNLDVMMADLDRVRLTIPADFVGAGRWARALGFTFSGDLPGFGLHGENHLEYLRWA